MRIGFLAMQPPGVSPSQRYRVEAFLPFLERRGIEVDYRWLLNREDLPVFYGHNRAAGKVRIAARAAWKRLKSVMADRRVDVFLVQREAFFLGRAWSEWLAHLRAPVVYDFDDALWIRDVSTGNRRYGWLKNVGKCAHVVKMARTTIAGNAYLGGWARQHSARVTVVPTCIDTDRFTPPAARPAGGPVTIGWSGSRSTIEHLRVLLPGTLSGSSGPTAIA